MAEDENESEFVFKTATSPKLNSNSNTNTPEASKLNSKSSINSITEKDIQDNYNRSQYIDRYHKEI